MQDGEPCRAYRHFLETLTPAAVERLGELAAPMMRFRDPFNEAAGLDEVKTVLRGLFRDVDDPRYTFTHCCHMDQVCLMRWHFTCRPRIAGKGHPWVADGVSEVRFDAQGLVVEHVEYWDAAHYVYERLPVLGWVLRRLKRRLAVLRHEP